jgi:hypothetical protein
MQSLLAVAVSRQQVTIRLFSADLYSDCGRFINPAKEIQPTLAEA